MATDALVATAEWVRPGIGIIEPVWPTTMRLTLAGVDIELRVDDDPGGSPPSADTYWLCWLDLWAGSTRLDRVGVYRGLIPSGSGTGSYNNMSGYVFTPNSWVPDSPAPYLNWPMMWWVMSLTVDRHTWPAGAGGYHVQVFIDAYAPDPLDDSPVWQDNVILEGTVPGLWGHTDRLQWSFRHPWSVADQTSDCDIYVRGLSAPWPVEPIVTGHLVESGVHYDDRPRRTYVQPVGGGGDDIGFATLWDRGLVVEPNHGGQMLARRESPVPTWGKVWRRLGPDNAWAAVPAAFPGSPDYRNGAIMVRDALRMHAQPVVYIGTQPGRQTVDLGASWTTDTKALRPVAARPLSDVVLDTHDGLRVGVGLDFSSGADRVFAWSVNAQGQQVEVTVCANARTSAQAGGSLFPFLYRRDDGRWACGWFTPWAYHEYLSDDVAGDAWSLNPLTPGLAGWFVPPADTDDPESYLGSAAFTAFWQGRDGQQAVAGYHFDSEAIWLLHRAGVDEVWDSAGPVASPTVAVSPYLYERDDGVWELGYLEAGSWVIMRAHWPGGTWSLVP